MNLLVDIGNTRLKWATAANGQLQAGSPLLNGDIGHDALAVIWRQMPRPRRMAIACVSAQKLSERVCSVALELWPGLEIIPAHSEKHAHGVYNAYPQPEKLGVDRWLALVAVRSHYQLPACIVDCGTALTVDLLDGQGRHQGGMICPGLTLMKKSLGQGADALPFVDTRHPLGPANYTEAAIYSGVLTAAVGLIEHILAGQKENCQLILTGGDARLLAEQLVYNPIVDADLVLRGLAIIVEGPL